jgi:Zn-dependent metalloprotease
MEEEIKKAYLKYLLRLNKKYNKSEVIPKMRLDLSIMYIMATFSMAKITFCNLKDFKENYLKQKEMEKTTTTKNEITLLRQALFIQGIEIHDKIIEVMIESYKLILEKGNKTTFKDALEVTKEINRRNKITIKYYTK